MSVNRKVVVPAVPAVGALTPVSERLEGEARAGTADTQVGQQLKLFVDRRDLFADLVAQLAGIAQRRSHVVVEVALVGGRRLRIEIEQRREICLELRRGVPI